MRPEAETVPALLALHARDDRGAAGDRRRHRGDHVRRARRRNHRARRPLRRRRRGEGRPGRAARTELRRLGRHRLRRVADRGRARAAQHAAAPAGAARPGDRRVGDAPRRRARVPQPALPRRRRGGRARARGRARRGRPPPGGAVAAPGVAARRPARPGRADGAGARARGPRPPRRRHGRPVHLGQHAAARRAIVHTHGGGLRAAGAGLEARCIHPGERVYIPMPFFWTGGFGSGLVSMLVAGATLVTETRPSRRRRSSCCGASG